jgi:DNA-directed RNA polymerase subunit RPC12/RpoP
MSIILKMEVEMMKERVIECLNCAVVSPKVVLMEDRGLISYKCSDCGANCFDKIEEDNHD